MDQSVLDISTSSSLSLSSALLKAASVWDILIHGEREIPGRRQLSPTVRPSAGCTKFGELARKLSR